MALIVCATRPRSRVARRLEFLQTGAATAKSRFASFSLATPGALAASGLAWSADQLLFVKIAGAASAALLGALVAMLVSVGPLAVLGLAYGGFVAPSLFVERRADVRRREAEAASGSLIEWLHALVACGRPVETALLTMANRGTGMALIDELLRRVERDYLLGAPLHLVLARESRASSLVTLSRLAERLERARELGQGSLLVLGDLRDDVRGSARDRAIERASGVEAKLTLILTLCYLPALALLVVIPLFLTLLAGLFT